MLYGQVVVGPPGSGKTTYCDGMQQYLGLLGRNPLVINLDPANTDLPYEAAFDVCQEVVSARSVMEETGLGPNGGLIYCLEYIESNINTLIDKIRSKLQPESYLVMDLPGQVELYTHSTCVQSILQDVSKALDLRLAAVQLFESVSCADPSKFLSSVLLGTTIMLRLELPMVSVLSKADLLVTMYGEQLPFGLDFFMECIDLDRLVAFIDQPHFDSTSTEENAWMDDEAYQAAHRKRKNSRFFRKYEKLHFKMAEVIEDFGLVSFLPLDISQADSVGRVLRKIDKCNGFVYVADQNVPADMFQCAVQHDLPHEVLDDVLERMSSPNEILELRHNAKRRYSQ